MDENAAVKAFFDARASTWDATCIHNPQKVAAIVTLAQVGAGKRVLDIACGTGVLLPELLAREPAEITELDLSAQMIAMARKKCNDPRVRFCAADVMDFDASGFDVALIYSAYPHFPDKAALARRVYGLLAAGGRLIVAHSESRAVINGRHSGTQVAAVSSALRPVREEAALWSGLFEMDLFADNTDFYFFSGVKKAPPPDPAELRA